MHSKKVAEVREFKQQVLVLQPRPEGHAWQQGDEGRFFHTQTTGALLEELVRRAGIEGYTVYMSDDPVAMKRVMASGFELAGTRYFALTGSWREDGKLILIPDQEKASRGLETLGIISRLESPDKAVNAGKHLNSALFGYFEHNAFWTVANTFRTLTGWAAMLVGPDGNLYSAHYTRLEKQYQPDTDNWALADGNSFMSPRGCQAVTGTPGKAGMLYRFRHLVEEIGYAKGHVQVIEHLKFDFVFNDPKSILAFAEGQGAWIGMSAQLDLEAPFTDVQAMSNFDLWQDTLAQDHAREFMRELVNARSEAQLRRRILRWIPSRVVDDPEGTMLMKAVRRGCDVLRFPGLFRRAIAYIFKCVLDCARGRVPMEGVAVYAYLVSDPAAVDEDGVIDASRSVIPEGSCICPRIETGAKIVIYRQPSGNANEKQMLRVIYDPRYRRFKQHALLVIGRGAAAMRPRLGGYDMDDFVIAVYDPTWVEAMLAVGAYPWEPYRGTQEAAAATNASPDALGLVPPQIVAYTLEHVGYQIDLAASLQTGVGQVTIGLWLDHLLSHPWHRAHLIQDLEAEIADLRARRAQGDKKALGIGKLEGHLRWLKQRPAWQLRDVDLEDVIDSLKKVGQIEHVQALGLRITMMIRETQVFPASMVKQGRFRGKRMAKNDYTIARTAMCSALEEIDRMVESYKNASHLQEWLMVATFSSPGLDKAYPAQPVVQGVARDMNRRWKTDLFNHREAHPGQGIDQAFWRSQEAKYEAEIEQRMSDKKLQLMFAIELARLVYPSRFLAEQARKDARGQVMPYSDSFLWSRPVARLLLEALEAKGLTGISARVELEPRYRRLAHSVVEVYVHASGIVQRKSDQAFLGETDIAIPEGIYAMDAGLILVREADACLKSVPRGTF